MSHSNIKFYTVFIALLTASAAFASCGTLPVFPSIAITSAHSDTLCTAGTASTFTATISNGGTSPVYQWQVNGIAAGTNSATYTAALQNNDLVSCRLYSNAPCITNFPVISNEIRMAVDEGGGVNLVSVIECQGHALSIAGAANASSIIWKYNNTPIDTALPLTGSYSSIIRAGGNGSGSALNQLAPSAIWVDSAGDIFASDTVNNCILFFAKGSTGATNGVIVAGGNGRGNAANQLSDPQGVYVDRHGNLLVADYGNGRVQKFAPNSTQASNGVTVAGGGSYIGSAANKLSGPMAVQEDDSDYIYVWDKSNNYILQFPYGTTQGDTGLFAGPALVGNTCAINGMWVLPGGNMFISNLNTEAVELYPTQYSVIGYTIIPVAGSNGGGSAANQLNRPAGIAVDGHGNIFVDDYGNSRVQQFPYNSSQQTNGVTMATGVLGQSISIDGGDNIYVAENKNYRVREFLAGTGVDTTLVPQAAGSYTAIVNTIGNCRTLTTATATVLPNVNSVIDTTVCMNSVIHIGNNSFSTAGTYYDTLYNAAANGCDSSVILHLQVDEIQAITPVIYLNGDTLTVYTPTAAIVNYSWSFDGQILTGDTGSNIIITQNGEYAAAGIDTLGCGIPTVTRDVNTLGIQAISNNFALSVQPNPANGRIVLQSQRAIGNNYTIYNVLGQPVMQGVITANSQVVTLDNAADGIYLLQVKDSSFRFSIAR